jgi:hypothetical protein
MLTAGTKDFCWGAGGQRARGMARRTWGDDKEIHQADKHKRVDKDGKREGVLAVRQPE